MFIIYTADKRRLPVYLNEDGKFSEDQKHVSRFKTAKEASDKVQELYSKGAERIFIGEICENTGLIKFV